MVSIKYIDLRIRSYVFPLTLEICDYPWMNIMLSGKSEYIVNGIPLILNEGNVMYFKKGDAVMRNEQYTDVRYLSIRFTTDEDDSELETIIPILDEHQKTLISLLQSYYFGNDMGEQENKKAAELVLELIIMELKKNCNRRDVKKRITEIHNFVSRYFSDGITSKDIAKYLGLNPSYCNTMYKNETGETLGELIDKVRFKHALLRLMYSQRSIISIAYECGFKDLYYFSKWFRKHTLLSPSEYRTKNKDAE